MDQIDGGDVHRENSSELVHTIARNFSFCLADFPANLKPEHLEVPADEQASLFSGLSTLRALIGSIYEYFGHLIATDEHWADREYCGHAIEGPVKLLWSLGVSGKLIQSPDGLELRSNRIDLDQALKKCGGRNPAQAFTVLEKAGIKSVFTDADGLPCQGGYKKCAGISVRYPVDNDPLLRALTYFAARLPANKATQKGLIFEIFLRADFRPLAPGYKIRLPHFPLDEEEVTRTFDPAILAMWREISGFMTRCHPQYRLYFRVPRIRSRGWVADYSLKDNDYGAWSIFIDEDGLSVRIVFSEKLRPYLLEHIQELSPRYQEYYLTGVACKDCVRCGKHVFLTHGDHVHRLCKAPWFAPPPISREDLPDIERLVDFRLANS